MTSRVVLTQTQHIPGLVWVLRQVLTKTPAIQTIVPAKIINTNKHRRVFDLKVTTPTPTGHKALARYQHRAQEVGVYMCVLSCHSFPQIFFVTKDDKPTLQAALNAVTGKGRVYK